MIRRASFALARLAFGGLALAAIAVLCWLVVSLANLPRGWRPAATTG